MGEMILEKDQTLLSKDQLISGRKKPQEDHSWPMPVRLVKATQNVWADSYCE